MRRFVVALLWLVALSIGAQAQTGPCDTNLPQSLSPPYVANGLDANCKLTPYQPQFTDLSFTSLFGASVTSSTQATVAQGNVQFVLDEPGAFAPNLTVQIRSPDDPLNFMYGTISAFDNSTGAINLTVTVFLARGGGTYANWVIQIVPGPPGGIQPAAAMAQDNTDSITTPVLGAQLTLTVDAGKAFTNTGQVYFQSLADSTSWFTMAVVSYDPVAGTLVGTVNLTSSQAGLTTYNLWSVFLLAPAGVDGSLIGFSQSTVSLAAGQATFTTQSGQFFPLNGQVLATCLTTPANKLAGQIIAYSGTSLIINVNAAGVYGSGSCSSWSIYLTTGPTTRISLYQMNGLQVSQVGTSAQILVNSGSVRDSGDVEDLVLSSPVTIDLSTLTNIVQVAQTGTITTSGTALTATNGIAGNFGGVNNFTPAYYADLSNQMKALYGGIFNSVGTGSVISTATAASLLAFVFPGGLTATTEDALSLGSATAFFRNGPVSTINTNSSHPINYAIVITVNQTTGATALSVTGATLTGLPDLPAGYSVYREIAYVGIYYNGSNYTTQIFQPMGQVLPTATNQVMVSPNNLAGFPQWSAGKLNLATMVTGTTGAANGGTGANNSSATGVQQWSSGTQSVSAALANGTTATTQSAGNNSTDVATTAYADRFMPKAIYSATITPTALGINTSTVNTSTGLITFASSFAGAGLATGMSVVLTGSVPTGLTTGTAYYINVQSNTTLFLYTTQANAYAGGSTGKAIPSGTTTGWSLRYFVYSNVFSQGFDTEAPVGATPGATAMGFDLNLTNALATTLGATNYTFTGLVDSAAAASNQWASRLFETYSSTTLVQIPNGGLVDAGGNLPGTWAQQSTTAFKVKVQVWG